MLGLLLDIDVPMDMPSSKKGAGSAKVAVNEEHVETLVSFGFQPEQARKALRESVSMAYCYSCRKELASPVQFFQACFIIV